jgi:hypothetical protein
MPEKMKKKIYAYVDESGQDTKGNIFVVSILVLESEVEKIQSELLAAEKVSGKLNIKWRKSSHKTRTAYLERVVEITSLRNTIFYDIFGDSKKYIEMTSYATAKAILKKADSDYKATVFVDGLKKGEVAIFIRGLKDLKIKTRKIRGIKKDENNCFIRLVDSICGLVRDADSGREWAQAVLQKLRAKKIAEEL